MQQNKSRTALVFIFITVLVDVIGLGIIIPVMPALIMELSRGGLSEASFYAGWITFVYAAAQFLFAPVIGGLSDQFGRRPVLLFSMLGFGLGYILLGLAPTLIWLFIGRFISGVTGATYSTAYAFVADISPPEKKAQNFSLIGAAFGLGFIIGPSLGGILGEYGSRIPFFAAAAVCFLNVIYGYFVLPESLKNSKRRSFDLKRANAFGSLRQIWKYPQISGLAVVFLLMQVAGHATQSTWAYFTMEKFNWTELTVGLSLGLVGVMSAMVQGGLSRKLIPLLGTHKTVYFGISMYVIGALSFALAPKSWMMFAVIVVYCAGSLASPTLQSIMSNRVSGDSQGELQGGLSSIISFSAIIGPPLMTNLFGFFTSDIAPVYLPGAPFILAALLLTTALLWVAKSLKVQYD